MRLPPEVVMSEEKPRWYFTSPRPMNFRGSTGPLNSLKI